LILLDEPTTVASAAQLSLYMVSYPNFAYAVNFPIQKFLQAQSAVTSCAMISATALVFPLVLTGLASLPVMVDYSGCSICVYSDE